MFRRWLLGADKKIAEIPRFGDGNYITHLTPGPDPGGQPGSHSMIVADGW